jgi:hypothetical protein
MSYGQSQQIKLPPLVAGVPGGLVHANYRAKKNTPRNLRSGGCYNGLQMLVGGLEAHAAHVRSATAAAHR